MELDKFTLISKQIYKSFRKDILRGLCLEKSVAKAAEVWAVRQL
jgi:hypothetical protein